MHTNHSLEYFFHRCDDDDVSHCKIACFNAVKSESLWLINRRMRRVYHVQIKFSNFFCLYSNEQTNTVIVFVVEGNQYIVNEKIFVLLLNACLTHIQIMIMRNANGHQIQFRRVDIFGFCLNLYECERDNFMHANDVSKRWCYEQWTHTHSGILKHSITSVCVLCTHYACMRWYESKYEYMYVCSYLLATTVFYARFACITYSIFMLEWWYHQNKVLLNS